MGKEEGTQFLPGLKARGFLAILDVRGRSRVSCHGQQMPVG